MSRPPPQGLDAHRALPATDVLIGRIAWLIRLRWVAAFGTLAFIEFAHRTLPVRLQVRPLYLLLAALAAYNLIAWLVLRSRARAEGLRLARDAAAGAQTRRPAAPALPPPDDQPSALGRWLLPRTETGSLSYNREAGEAATFALVQITVDLLFLGLLIHFSGGVENPLWVFFTFHVLIASVLLSAQATYAVATLGTLLLAGVVLGELTGVLRHYSLQAHWGTQMYLEPSLAGLFVFLQAITLFIVAYLASSIARRLRRREVDVMMLTHYLVDRTARLEAAYQELSVAEKSKSQYMRKVAHELRQPLGTIKTALAVALQNSSDCLDPQTRGLIERAERRAGALAEMTQELLSLSRARAGRAAVELVPVEIAAVASRVLDELQAKALAAGVALSIELQLGLPRLQGDPEGLGDLLVNLIGNAIRYTPPGGRVWFRARRGDDHLVLEVEDTGIGIAEADRSRIFDEFYRSPAAREHTSQGSGLGLPIARAVVEQHRGTISVHEREGGGTRFHVELPFDDRGP